MKKRGDLFIVFYWPIKNPHKIEPILTNIENGPRLKTFKSIEAAEQYLNTQTVYVTPCDYRVMNINRIIS